MYKLNSSYVEVDYIGDNVSIHEYKWIFRFDHIPWALVVDALGCSAQILCTGPCAHATALWVCFVGIYLHGNALALRVHGQLQHLLKVNIWYMWVSRSRNANPFSSRQGNYARQLTKYTPGLPLSPVDQAMFMVYMRPHLCSAPSLSLSCAILQFFLLSESSVNYLHLSPCLKLCLQNSDLEPFEIICCFTCV